MLAGLSLFVVSNWPTWFTLRAALPTFRLQDWLAQLGIVYFGSHYSGAWWSLNVEVIFYLLMPLLIPLFRRVPDLRSAFTVLAASMALPAAAWLLAPFFARSAVPETFPQLALYAPCFVAGLLLSRFDFPRSSRVFSRWHLVWLGERSYSLFLTHVPVIVLVYQLTAMVLPRGLEYLIVTRLIAVPLCLLSAMLVFTYVERRFARGLTTAGYFWPWRPSAPPLALDSQPAVA